MLRFGQTGDQTTSGMPQIQASMWTDLEGAEQETTGSSPLAQRKTMTRTCGSRMARGGARPLSLRAKKQDARRTLMVGGRQLSMMATKAICASQSPLLWSEVLQ